MRPIIVLCFIFTLPLLAAIGHDIWHAYTIGPAIDPNKPFPFSDAGWIWTHYSPDSFNWARVAVPPAFWKQYIGPVLEHKTVTVTGVVAAFFYAIALFMKLFGLGGFSGSGLLMSRGIGFSRRKGSVGDGLPSTRKKMTYKRK